MHLGFGADIYSSSRFIDDQHLRIKQKPFRQNDLLLVATAQTLHGLHDIGRSNPEGLSKSFGGLSLLSSAHPPGSEGVELCRSDVRGDAHFQEQASFFAVLRHISDSRSDRVARRINKNSFIIQKDFTIASQ